MEFQVTTSSLDHEGLLIRVQGEFDMSTSHQVEDAAEAAVAAHRPLLLDLSDCSFVDSTALRLLFKLHHALADGRGPSAPMAVVASSPVRKLISLTGIDQAIPVFLNREQALESLSASQSLINGGAGKVA